MCFKKGVLFLVLFLLIFIPLVSSQQVIQVNQPQQEQEQGWFAKYFGFVTSPIFWGAILFIVLIGLILLGIFFLIRWLIKYIKSKNDVFIALINKRIKLAKVHRRYPSKSWFKVHKNTPIRLVKKVDGKLIVSNPVAYHRGDYVTHEGNYIISMNLIGINKWLFFPITDLLVIPNKEKVEIKRKDEKGKEYTITIDNLPKAKDIIQFNENDILIHAESLSNVGLFYVPVLFAKDGKIIDLSLPVYQSLKEVVLGEYLFDQTSSFVGVAKKSIELNPNLRYDVKTKDNSSSVEVPQGDNR